MGQINMLVLNYPVSTCLLFFDSLLDFVVPNLFSVIRLMIEPHLFFFFSFFFSFLFFFFFFFFFFDPLSSQTNPLTYGAFFM